MSGSSSQVAPPLLLIGTKRDTGAAGGPLAGSQMTRFATSTKALPEASSLASEAEACLSRWRGMFADAGAAVS